MVSTYGYSVLSTIVDVGQLKTDILGSSITAGLRQILSGSNGDIKIQFASALSGADKTTLDSLVATRIGNARSTAVVFSIQNEATNGTTSTSFVDADTLTVTNLSGGDFLVLAGAELSSGALGDSEMRVLLNGSTTLGSEYVTLESNYVQVEIPPVLQNLADGNHTLKIQYRSTLGTATAQIRRRRIIMQRVML